VTSFETHIDKQLQDYHKKSPFSDYLREIVYGGSDGIVTTLAVINGFFGAGGDANFALAALLLFSFANLFADGVSMGLGNFLSERSEKANYKMQARKESKQLEKEVDLECGETRYFLEQRGYEPEDARQLAVLISKNKPYWLEFMMENELDLHDPRGSNSFLTALFTFISFLVFGFIPIIPFLVVQDPQLAFGLALVGAFIALIILGLTRWYLTREKWYKAVFETVLVGTIASSVAYVVGVAFK
jgi:VIT1/CCC1 family predicted Fe2+/Mn2+ transporter